MKKYKYYLALSDNDEEFENLNITELEKFEIKYNTDIPDYYGDCSYTENIKSKKVKSYNTLTDLIVDYMYNMDIDDEIELDNDDFDMRMDELIEDILVLRYTKKTKTFSRVRIHEIANCLSQILSEQATETTLNKVDMTLFEKFTDTIESLIESDCSFMNTYHNEHVTYQSIIAREKGKQHKKMKQYSSPVVRNGFIYEEGYENLKSFVNRQLSYGNDLTCIFKADIEGSKKLMKVYVCYIFNINGMMVFDFLKSHDVFDCFKQYVEIKDFEIYSGLEKDDVICGFDHV